MFVFSLNVYANDSTCVKPFNVIHHTTFELRSKFLVDKRRKSGCLSAKRGRRPLLTLFPFAEHLVVRQLLLQMRNQIVLICRLKLIVTLLLHHDNAVNTKRPHVRYEVINLVPNFN